MYILIKNVCIKLEFDKVYLSPMAANVPLGISLDGFFRSPDMSSEAQKENIMKIEVLET